MTKSNLLLRTGLAGFAFAILAPADALAQDALEGNYTVSLGAGVQTYAKYPGGDSYGINPWPILSVRRQGTPLRGKAPDDGLGAGILPRGSTFNFGPQLRFQNKREEDDVGAAVGDVGFTVEVGAFVEVFPIENVRIRADLRQGIGGHESIVGTIGADYFIRDDYSYVFSIGPRVRWADNDYHDAYFGISPTVAAATGLPAFDPGGDFYSVGAMAGYTQMLGRNWGLSAYAGYERMMGDAAASPIVRNFGSRDQFFGGIGLFYSFDIRL